MKTFDTLYKRTKTGAVQYWALRVRTDTTYPVIDKESGQLGTTSPIVHQEVIKQGVNIGKANETSPLEQALSQAESDWRRKHDEGYKSLKDLGITEEGDPDLNKIWYRVDNLRVAFNKLPDILDTKLPQFNTDAAGNVKPMLATDWKKIKKIDYPCYIEPKLDGVRCLMLVAPDTGNVVFLSRSGKEYTTLQHIKEEFSLNVLSKFEEDFILDGEIYSDELTFQEIIQAVKKTCPNSKKLHFRCYDVVNDMAQTDRRDVSSELVKLVGSEFIQHIKWETANDAEAVKAAHDMYVASGNEGAMLRMFGGKYAQGQRSRELLKVKEFDEQEFDMTGYEFGARQEDLIAICQTESGKVFRAKVEGSREQKIKFEQEYQEAYETEKSIKLTVKHFGWTNDKLPRFPIGKALRLYE